MQTSTVLLIFQSFFFDACALTTLIAPGAESQWKYYDGAEAAAPEWREISFDDSKWKSGKAPLGYGERELNTTISFGGDSKAKRITAYFRHSFDFKKTDDVREFAFLIRQDDGAVVYLNGKEIYRYNLPAGEVQFDTRANKTLDGHREDRYRRISVPVTSLKPGKNVVAAEVHQSNPGSSDLIFDLVLRGYGEKDVFLPGKVPQSARTVTEAYHRKHYVGAGMTIPDGYSDGGRGMKLYPDGAIRTYREVIVLDRSKDAALRKHIEFATSKEIEKLPPEERAKRIARYIDQDMSPPRGRSFSGGPVGVMESEYANRQVLLGEISTRYGAGVCRHRSLLFKVMGDAAGLDVALVRGKYKHRYNRGFGGHAWNELILKSGKKFIVDVTRPNEDFSFLDATSQKAVERYLDTKTNRIYQPTKAEQN
ncbi:MAG: hypothetical protein QGF00_23400 [Planctomycetota bacterium]|jgi:hypothetical protein|nr:hypothetical protein [Planctomycetota bacterium]MDP7252577.1 hypothetical protein [Planctomycetota bacterium]